MMPRRLTIAVVATLLAAACREPLGPLGYSLTGSWVSGFRVEEGYLIAITQSGDTLSGTGTWTRNINPPTLSLTVGGTDQAGHVRFRLLSPGVDWFLDFDGIATIRNDTAMLVGNASFMVGGTDTMTFIRAVPFDPPPP